MQERDVCLCSLYSSVQVIGNSPFPPQRVVAGWWLLFVMTKGGSIFCCRPLITHLRNRAGLSTAGFSPFILTVDCSGWVCYLCFNHLPKEIIFLSTTFQENLLILGFPSVLDRYISISISFCNNANITVCRVYLSSFKSSIGSPVISKIADWLTIKKQLVFVRIIG